MFDELNKYKENDHFFFTSANNLGEVCNAPTDKSGIYLVYALQNGTIELVYVGCSGRIGRDGTLSIRSAGLGGIKDRIVNGHQFGKIPRRISWLTQMTEESIEALDVYWYATHNDKYVDCPRKIEEQLLEKHSAIFGRLPRWNRRG